MCTIDLLLNTVTSMIGQFVSSITTRFLLPSTFSLGDKGLEVVAVGRTITSGVSGWMLLLLDVWDLQTRFSLAEEPVAHYARSSCFPLSFFWLHVLQLISYPVCRHLSVVLHFLL